MAFIELPLIESNLQGIGMCALRNQVLMANLDEAAGYAAKIVQDGFGPHKKTSVERMAERLTAEGNVIFAINQHRQPIGFLSYKVIDDPKYKIIYYTRIISQAHQKQGLASQLLQSTLNIEQPNIISARTQNPAAVLSMLKDAHANGWVVMPFQIPYDASPQTKTILQTVTQALDIKNIDLATGLCPNVYAEGKLGNYEINLADPRIVEIENKFASYGLNRYRGDALLYCAYIKQYL